jgi:hypothetical protein
MWGNCGLKSLYFYFLCKFSTNDVNGNPVKLNEKTLIVLLSNKFSSGKLLCAAFNAARICRTKLQLIFVQTIKIKMAALC